MLDVCLPCDWPTARTNWKGPIKRQLGDPIPSRIHSGSLFQNVALASETVTFILRFHLTRTQKIACERIKVAKRIEFQGRLLFRHQFDGGICEFEKFKAPMCHLHINKLLCAIAIAGTSHRGRSVKMEYSELVNKSKLKG